MAQVFFDQVAPNAGDDDVFDDDDLQSEYTEYSTDAFEGFEDHEDDEDFNWDDWTDEETPSDRPAKRVAGGFDADAGAIDFPGEPIIPTAGPLSMAGQAGGFGTLMAGSMPYSDQSGELSDQIVDLFPDICPVYVRDLVARHGRRIPRAGPKATQEERLGIETTVKEMVVEEILENPSYPTRKQLKRKRDESPKHDEDEKKYELATHDGNPMYLAAASTLLSDTFPHVPIQYIRQLLKDKKNLFCAFLSLSAEENAAASTRPPYERLKRARIHGRYGDGRMHLYNLPVWEQLQVELRVARVKLAKDAEATRKKKEEEEAENRNVEQHAQAGTLVECQCCYADVPPNRAISCHGADAHFFCYSCIRKSAETQIGMMKYSLQCFDTSGCQAGFTRSELAKALGSSLMTKLDDLQQQDEISRANIEGLEGCPFCDYKAICAPVEEDREFRCCNPSCEIVSCRLCREVTHIPKTCDEAKRDKGISERHLVEEAMSEALIRNCPRCQVKIVKEFGCNKMTCTKCGCVMCYLCKKDISRQQYAHFGRGPNSCRVDDDPGRDRKAIEQAEKTTIEKIRAENPGLTQEELEVRLPESTAPNRTRVREMLNLHHLQPGRLLNHVHADQWNVPEPVLQGFNNLQRLLMANAARPPRRAFDDDDDGLLNGLNYIPQADHYHHPNNPGDQFANLLAGPAANGLAAARPAGTGVRDDPVVIDDNVQPGHPGAPAIYADPLAGYMPAAGQQMMAPAAPHPPGYAYAYPYLPNQQFAGYGRNGFFPF